MAQVNDYVEVAITDGMLEAARVKLSRTCFDGNRALNKFGSEADRTLLGYLGERMVMHFLSISEDEDSPDFDMVYRNRRLEVKSIGCAFKPRPHYDSTVNSHDLAGVHKQSADYYVFVRILADSSKGWIVGYLPCDTFFKLGRFVEKGDEGFEGKKFEKANATLLAISKLLPPKGLLKL